MRLATRLVAAVVPPERIVHLPTRVLEFMRDARHYRALPGTEPISLTNLWPQLFDRTAVSPFDAHYVYQGVWAARHLAHRAPPQHVDVGSQLSWVAFLTVLCEVTFIDIRPPAGEIAGLRPVRGDILELPLEDRSVASLSCLHVAEHVGLGRYGDALSSDGTKRAAMELARVLAPRGELLFSVPVGRPRVCFNAHRIHSPTQVTEMFADLELLEFSAVDDAGRFHADCPMEAVATAEYACGMFRFTRA